MFGFFPFFNNYNNNSYNGNNFNRIGNSNNINFDNLFNEEFLTGIMGSLLSSDVVNNLISDISQEDTYDVELREYDEYYLIKGYLPGVGPKDVSIDFEKNKAILTIKRKQTYSNGVNAMVTVIQSGGDLTKNFYIGEVDVSKLRASFDNSLLLLTIPKVKRISEEPIQTIEATIIDVDNYTVE